MFQVLILAILLQGSQSDLLKPSLLSFTTIELNEALSMTSSMQSLIDENITRHYLSDYTQRNSSHIAAIQVNLEYDKSIDYHQRHFIDLLTKCTNVLLAVKDEPSSTMVVSKAYFMLPTQQELLYFRLDDIVFNQDKISPCVTEENLRKSELARQIHFQQVFYCPLLQKDVVSLVESTRNFTNRMLRPRVKAFSNATGEIAANCLITDVTSLVNQSKNLTFFKQCTNVLMQESTDGQMVTVYFMFKAEDASLYLHTSPFVNQTLVKPCYTNEELRKSKKDKPKAVFQCIVAWIIFVVLVISLIVCVAAVVCQIIRKLKKKTLDTRPLPKQANLQMSKISL